LSRLKQTVQVLGIIIFFTNFLDAAEKSVFSLKGSFLAYSYDHNQIYGENVEWVYEKCEGKARYIKIDLPSRAFYAYGNVVLKSGQEIVEADELSFNPFEKKATLVRYDQAVEVIEFEAWEKGEPPLKIDSLEELTLSRIQKSLIYFTGPQIEVMEDYAVYGYEMTLYVEGLESVGFTKLRMSEGLKYKKEGISFDRIWYTKSQGIIARLRHSYELENKIVSLSRLHYEERSVLKNYQGEERQIDFTSTTAVRLKNDFAFGISGNYNSAGLWDSQVSLNKNWKDKLSLAFQFSYYRPPYAKGEGWFGTTSRIKAGKSGFFQVGGKFGLNNQVLADISYSLQPSNNLSFFFSSSYAQVRYGFGQDYSKIWSGQTRLTYSSPIFNLSSDYYLNYDLFGNQLLCQPRLRFEFNPVTFYNGILVATLYNQFIFNRYKFEDLQTHSYSNNTALNLRTEVIPLWKGFSLNLNAVVEQFLEKERRNFTSLGLIFEARQNLTKGFSVQGYFSAQSRRKTENWLIEGTTSQDISTVFVLNPAGKLNAWWSFSYDPKHGKWKQSFADLTIGIIKNWSLHSLFHYDFFLKKINNVDMYLIRQAGRFQIRFIWRSLSKQFLVELVPG